MIYEPACPIECKDTDISLESLQKLLGKTLYLYGVMTPSRIASEMRLPPSIVNELLKGLQKLQFVEARGLAGDNMRAELRYALGGAGFEWVAEAQNQSQYVGPAPVSLNEFVKQIHLQSIAHEVTSRAEILESLSHLVIPENIVDKLGPAVNSARSILLYGEPGNGKTSIAEAVGKTFKSNIYIPYCFEIGGQIINFFDPTIHTPVENGNNDALKTRPTVDPRWQLCSRPFVLTGGELSLEMLDLSFNPIARYYEAPIHFKATGGVFVVDDFGRQRTDPQSILNRWIVPLERHYDHLTLHTGKKFAVPFDQLAIFSTNKNPEELADAAGLRRLHYKIKVPTPTASDYRQIFIDAVTRNKIAFDEGIFQAFFEKYYVAAKAIPAGHHPKYMSDYIIAVCQFKNETPHLTAALLDDAWENLHTSAT